MASRGYSNPNDAQQWSGYETDTPAPSVSIDTDGKHNDETAFIETVPPPTGISPPERGIKTDFGFLQSSPRLWAGEIASLVTGMLLMTTIVIVLARVDGERPPQWTMGVTLNTLLAFLVSLARIAFMYPIIEGLAQLKWIWFTSSRSRPLYDFQLFDDASRSQLGCLKLLFRLKGPIACLGALISISGIITSTITQQTVDYQQIRAVEEGVNASMPRATSFSQYREGDINLGPWEMVRAKQAMLNGALNMPNSTFPYLTPECPSGFCDWEPYGSLAVCSEVRNLTATGNATLLSELEAKAYARTAAIYNSATIFMKDGILFNSFPMTELPPSFPVLIGMLSEPTHVFNDSVYQAMVGDYFVAYSDSTMTSTTVYTSTFHILEIAFFWCTKSYTTQVRDGVATTQELGTHTRVVTEDPHNLNFAWALDFDVCYMAGNCNETIGGRSIEMAPPPNVTTPMPYVINAWTSLLSSILVSSTMYDSLLMDERRGIITSTGGGVAQAFASSLFGDFQAPQSPEPEEQMRNTLGIADNIARALTNHIMEGDTRFQEGGSETSLVRGTVYTPQTFVKIHWKFVVVLAVQILLTVVFLIGTVIATHRSGAHIIKGSSLATMMALSDDMRRQLGDTSDIGAMNRRAQRIKVRLERSDSGNGNSMATGGNNNQAAAGWPQEVGISKTDMDSLSSNPSRPLTRDFPS